jgi:hypothetical protein
MREAYEKWLMDQLLVDEEEDGYSELCKILGKTPYLPFMEMDINRGDDGMALRDEWVDEKFGDCYAAIDARFTLDEEIGGGTCSMLELLVILCRKIQYEMLEGPYEAGIFKWFLELLGNCGLDKWTNEKIAEDVEKASDDISELLGTVIFHRFGWDGEGSLFPLRYAREDQREMDLMTQMNNYIAENYDIC